MWKHRANYEDQIVVEDCSVNSDVYRFGEAAIGCLSNLALVEGTDAL